MLKRLFVIFICFSAALSAVAQTGGTPLTVEALMLCNENKLDSAKYCTDRDVKEGGINDAWSWTIRGYVYKAIYKEREKKDKSSASRETSLESYKIAIKLDVDKKYEANTHQGVNYLSNSLYNDAVTSLNTIEYEVSEICYAKYKESALIINPNLTFEDKDLLYYNVQGSSVFSILADRESDYTKKNEFIEKALKAYARVLEIDPRNFSANYNSGVLFYNQGVNKIKEIDPLAPFDSVIIMQERSNQLFEKAKPYMLKANKIDPTKREVYIGLSGIYFSLNMIDSSNFFSQELVNQDNKGEDPSLQKMKIFNDAFTPVKAWIHAEGRFPSSQSENEIEKQYANWLIEMRLDYKGKRLLPQMIESLESLPEWAW